MWNLYQGDEFLNPLKFSNGKTQEDVVKEVLNSIEEGHKIIFINGKCGTGKSAIALHLAKELGRASIVVPIKNLQEQYKADYEGDKYLVKKNGEELKIRVITGRKNHICEFIKGGIKAIPTVKKEIDLKLDYIFEKKGGDLKRKKDLSADRYDLPCKIEIKEKNIKKLKRYIKKNKHVHPKNFQTIRDIKRISVAYACPYWSPVIDEKYELKIFEDVKKKTYEGLNGKKFVFYQRKPGCKFYEQFNSYIEADVIVFNSLKYILESLLERKPLTDVEIIDECDEFLDSLSNQRNINIDGLQNALLYVFSIGENVNKVVDEMQKIISHIKRDEKIKENIENNSIIPIKQTGIYNLFKCILDHPELLDEIDDESYLFDFEETAKMFEDFMDETFVIFSKKDENLIAGVVTINLAKKFEEIVNRNKIIILMSGTLHSDEVLKKIFGLNQYKIIEAETQHPGQIDIVMTGLEMDCKYSNFSKGKYNKESYWKALSKCLKIAKKPVLVHVNAFSDLPTQTELEKLDINNLISRERLKEIQEEDKIGKLIGKFKGGQIDVLFSTRASRGIDFPGQQCNSIVFTKYPNPNINNAFWKILEKTRPQHYWYFYKDKARRELWQKAYRALRFKEDHVYVLSPDIRVLEAFK